MILLRVALFSTLPLSGPRPNGIKVVVCGLGSITFQLNWMPSLRAIIYELLWLHPNVPAPDLHYRAAS